jgi:hypothetical protein
MRASRLPLVCAFNYTALLNSFRAEVFSGGACYPEHSDINLAVCAIQL